MRKVSTVSTSNGCLPTPGGSWHSRSGLCHRWPDRFAVSVLGIPLDRQTRLSGMVPRHLQTIGYITGRTTTALTELAEYSACAARLFGTYADEREEEPIVYGIRKPLKVESGAEHSTTTNAWLKVKCQKLARRAMLLYEPDWSPADQEIRQQNSNGRFLPKHRSLAPPSIRLSGIANTLVSLNC